MPLLEEFAALLFPIASLNLDLVQKLLHLWMILLPKLFKLELGGSGETILPLFLRLFHHHFELVTSVSLCCDRLVSFLHFINLLNMLVVVLPSVKKLIEYLQILSEYIATVIHYFIHVFSWEEHIVLWLDALPSARFELLLMNFRITWLKSLR